MNTVCPNIRCIYIYGQAQLPWDIEPRENLLGWCPRDARERC